MLHDRIKECRLRAGLSQAQLVTRLGVSRQAVTKWESGRVAVPRDGSSSVSRRTRHRCTEVPGRAALRGTSVRCGSGAHDRLERTGGAGRGEGGLDVVEAVDARDERVQVHRT